MTTFTEDKIKHRICAMEGCDYGCLGNWPEGNPVCDLCYDLGFPYDIDYDELDKRILGFNTKWRYNGEWLSLLFEIRNYEDK